MLYCVIVSHKHEGFIKNLFEYSSYSNDSDVRFLVKDNVGSNELKEICSYYHVDYIGNHEAKGFGRNNNEAVQHIISHNNVDYEKDYVLFLNPDVLIKQQVLQDFYNYISREELDSCTIDLFRNQEFTVRDEFVRKFPHFYDFITSILINVNKTKVDRSNLTKPTEIEWCAGSFICTRLSVFLKVMGFDERYFMYCEDIDFCYRLKLFGVKLIYLPQFRAVHLAMHGNRKLLSKAFRWHVTNALYFIYKKAIYKDYASFSSSVKTIFRG